MSRNSLTLDIKRLNIVTVKCEYETVPKISSGTSLNDVEWSLTRISRSWIYHRCPRSTRDLFAIAKFFVISTLVARRHKNRWFQTRVNWRRAGDCCACTRTLGLDRDPAPSCCGYGFPVYLHSRLDTGLRITRYMVIMVSEWVTSYGYLGSFKFIGAICGQYSHPDRVPVVSWILRRKL